jgi:type VI secretion system protein ImpC
MSMHFSFSTGPGQRNPVTDASPRADRPDDARPFRILVIADFSGRAGRGVREPLAGRRIHSVDLDALDELPATLGTSVRVRQDPVHDIPIRSIDDLHPDHLHDHAELFAALRDLRKRVKDPATFEDAAAEIAEWARGNAPLGSQIEPKPTSTATPESEFAAMLKSSVGGSSSKEKATVESLLKQIIGPYIIPDRDPRQDELIALVNDAIAREMRALLHTPEWRTVEAAWRGLQTLVTGLELDEDLQLAALDASPAELNADADALEDPLITRPVQTAGGHPWSLILHLCDHDEDTAPGLGALATLAHRAGAPLVASIAAHAAGVSDWPGGSNDDPDTPPNPTEWSGLAPALEDLAHEPAAHGLCLTFPRVIARLPYAPGLDETDRFVFDETAGMPEHAHVLWTPGPVLVALLLGSAFTRVGWNLEPVGGGTVDDLPAVTRADGQGLLPCAEAWLSDRHAAALQQMGLTPLLSVQNRGAVQVTGLRSLAGTPLACRW